MSNIHIISKVYHNLNNFNNVELLLIIIFSNFMVGRVGYAPTTPAMSMQYSTIELTAR